MGFEGYTFSKYEGFSNIDKLNKIDSNYGNIISRVTGYTNLRNEILSNSEYKYSSTDFSNYINEDEPEILIKAREQDKYNQLLQTNISYSMGSIACVTLLIAAIIIARE
jgi:hypothetical protein